MNWMLLAVLAFGAVFMFAIVAWQQSKDRKNIIDGILEEKRRTKEKQQDLPQ